MPGYLTYSTDLLLPNETGGAAGTNAAFQTGQVLPVQAYQDLSLSSAVQHAAYDETYRFWWLQKEWMIMGWPIIRFLFQNSRGRKNVSRSLTTLSNTKVI